MHSYEWEPISCTILAVKQEYSSWCRLSDDVNDGDKCYDLFLKVRYVDPNTELTKMNNKVCPNADCRDHDTGDMTQFLLKYEVGDEITCYYDINSGKMKLNENSSDFPKVNLWMIVGFLIVIFIAWCWPVCAICDN